MNPIDRQAFCQALLNWHAEHARALPWRGERDPYRIWVSEIMLQQTTVQTVSGYWTRFLEAFPTVQALADAPQEQVLKAWEGLGYYSRARNLQKAAQIVTRDCGGTLPRGEQALRALPGIGAYTAAAIASMAWDEPALAMDGNLIRALSRLAAEQGQTDKRDTLDRLRAFGQSLIDPYQPGEFNQAMMGLGRMVCLPAKPQCERCPVAGFCAARKAGLEQELPHLPPRLEKKVERRGVALVFCGNRVLVRKRPEHGLLAGLWEFPHFLDACDAPALSECLNELGIAARGGKPVAEASHTFTHRVWRMMSFAFEADALPAGDTLRAVSRDELDALPMASAMRAFRMWALEQLNGVP